MYPQISVASLNKIKSERNKHWPEIYIQKWFSLIPCPKFNIYPHSDFILFAYSYITWDIDRDLSAQFTNIYGNHRKKYKNHYIWLNDEKDQFTSKLE